MTTSTDLRHVSHLAKQFGKIRSFALEALLHSAMNSMEGELNAATGHTMGQNVDAMGDLLYELRNGNEVKNLDAEVFARLLARDDVDGSVVTEAEDLCKKLDTLRTQIEGGAFPSTHELDELFETYTALRIRTSGFLRQVESLTEEWQAALENSVEIRQHMASTITDLERMSGAINILAINASVEASRAGSSGAAFRVIANEMQRLSQRSSGMLQSTRHTLGL
ncbi:MAG: methyl-accepting chemotaxis protein [Paracoccaceae bacterium]